MNNNDSTPSNQGRVAAVQTIIRSTADWRELQGKKYPADSRNAHASQLLRGLANETPSLPGHLVAELDACRSLGKATATTARRVAFSLFPAGLAEFVDAVLECAAAEERARDSGFANRGAVR